MICTKCKKDCSQVLGTLVEGDAKLCCRWCWSINHLDNQIDVGMSLLKGIVMGFHILSNEKRTSVL